MGKGIDYNYEFKVWNIFNQASEAMIKAYENELFRQFGISRIQLGVLFIVENSAKPLSPTEISRMLLREPHTTAALINRMEKQGLVKKTRDKRMKNIKRVSLTREGKELLTKAMRVNTPYELISCLSPEEKDALLICSEKIRDEALKHLTVRRFWEPLFFNIDIAKPS